MTIAVNSTGLVLAIPNIIIGGNFSTNPWQRGTTFTGVANAAVTYTADRFLVNRSNDAVVDVLKTADSPTTAEAGIYSTSCFHHDVTTADGTIAAGQYELVGYRAEGYDISAAAFGQSGAKQITLSFWHKHTKIGTYCVAFANSANDRCYIAEYSQAVTDTWEKATITITADAAGTWLYTNGVGLGIYFAIASGATFQTAAGAWTAGQYFSSSNQVNGLDSNSNNFKLALVKLELGAVATPYPVELEADVLARCQRYFFKTFSQGVTPSDTTDDASGALVTNAQVANINASNAFGETLVFPVEMRTAPNMTLYNYRAAGTDGQWDNGSASLANAASSSVGTREALIYDGGATVSVARYFIHATASAEL